MVWEKGRQLKSMSKTGNSLSFEYNANGIRTKKTANGIIHNYYLQGSNILFETIKDDTNIKTLQYLYDNNDEISGINYNGDNYYFVKNLQGDIIKLIDSNSNCVVKYTYDAWGKVVKITDGEGLTISDNDSTHIANINPFRYRGYYYDVETKLYYLQSRYYDPEICRFINADDVNMILLSKQLVINLFAYFKNDYINIRSLRFSSCTFSGSCSNCSCNPFHHDCNLHCTIATYTQKLREPSTISACCSCISLCIDSESKLLML